MAGGHPGHTASFANASPSTVANTLQPCLDNMKQPEGQRTGDLQDCTRFLQRGAEALANYPRPNPPNAS